MRILLLIVLICNVSALILALISMYITNRLFKEYERKIKLIYSICKDARFKNHNDNLNKELMGDILFKIISIIERGY